MELFHAGVENRNGCYQVYSNEPVHARVSQPPPRLSVEASPPMPTAANDSGQRSRTSKMKGTRFNFATQYPATPTSNCGDVAMTTSGELRNEPVSDAEAQNEL